MVKINRKTVYFDGLSSFVVGRKNEKSMDDLLVICSI